MTVCCECCVLLGRGLWDELITLLEKSYRMWCVLLFDLRTSWMRRPWPTGDCRAKNKQTKTNWLSSCLFSVLLKMKILPLRHVSFLIKHV